MISLSLFLSLVDLCFVFARTDLSTFLALRTKSLLTFEETKLRYFGVHQPESRVTDVYIYMHSDVATVCVCVSEFYCFSHHLIVKKDLEILNFMNIYILTVIRDFGKCFFV